MTGNTLEQRAEVEQVLSALEFGNRNRCPMCAGFDPKGNGETDRRHTKTCPVPRVIAALRLSAGADWDAEEDAYVIQRTTELLARIAIIVNGPEPKMTRWSYHDLPEKVQALKDAVGVAQVSDGFVVVPREPTEEMAHAGVRAWDTPPADPYQLGVARETYRAMLAASHPAPAQQAVNGSQWRSIHEMTPSDDLYWFTRGDTVDGPRESRHDDADYWDFFAPVKWPPLPAAPRHEPGEG